MDASSLDGLTREQLEDRRNELHVRLAAVNDRLRAMGATRNGDLAAGRMHGFHADTIEPGSLEPSAK